METLNLIVWIFALVVNFSRESSANPPNSVEHQPLTWTLYKDLGTKTWNEASEFCKQQGGHLAAPKTNVAMHALQTFVQKWTNKNITSKDIWIGLHSSMSGTIPNVWEADCSTSLNNVQYWYEDAGEPDQLHTSSCVRLTYQQRLWRTMSCGNRYSVICEQFSAGTCPFKSLHDVTMTAISDASAGDVNSVSKCWSFCLGLLQNGTECVAAVLEVTRICKLYLGVRQLDQFDITTAPSLGSTIMLRDCFQMTLDEQSYGGFTFANASNTPYPANGTCSTLYKASVDLPDYMPPAVQPGLVALTTTTTRSRTTEYSTLLETTATAATIEATSTDSEQRTCPCHCCCGHNNGSASGQTDLPLVSVNKTAKYRRSKTSAMISKTSYTVVGTIWIFAAAVFGLFILCDLKYIKIIYTRIHERRERRVNVVTS